ncbi:MAG TPA: ribonuclease R, partial [Candidatus Kapabacteria bacterium]|nr:ribonuclease R [Candidatus Kapabacteria bacterium]
EGLIKFTPTGNALVHPSTESAIDDTILVRKRDLGDANDGDIVKVALLPKKKDDRPQGEVLEVVERPTKAITGKVRKGRSNYYVVPEDSNGRDIMVTRKDLQGAREGDRVHVELYDLQDEFGSPEGRVTTVMGQTMNFKDEMAKLAEEYNLPGEFPQDVLDEAHAYPEEIPKAEIAKRLDLRGETIFTIDPEDAKDFDDAVSLTKNDDGTLQLGVHIADVSHYVTEGSALDEEALFRGTSVYLVGGVIPMLPERLSNELCSLRPDEDKLTYSVFMDVEPDTGKVVKASFAKSVIRSVMRFSYEEAEERTMTGKGKYAKLLREMKKLSEKLYQYRRQHGSIDFETDEVRFRFDENWVPVEAYKKERLGSMRMIEDFMLAANRAVAEFISRKAKQGRELPFLYRIHADPDPEKLRELAILAKALGYDLKAENASPATIQKFLDSIKGKPEEKLLNQLMLRSMAKAVYAEHNVGHFGLAFMHYTHFTSPIRRYPDLIVHRMLFQYQQKGGMKSERMHQYYQELPDIADQTSNLERRATEAERASNKVAQMFLLKDLVGEEFEATVSGVTNFGLFVQLENGAEGLVHVRQLPGRFYFDEVHYTLVQQSSSYRGPGGMREKSKSKRYRMGDKLRVQLIRVNQERREVDFRIVEDVI